MITDSTPTIGILAGMGPRSTAPFVDLVVTECQRQYGAKEDLDFPPMMIYSLPTPFYDDRPIDHAAMKRALCAGLQKLESTGVSFIAMPCNSAHVYFDDVTACVSVPLISMIDVALRAMPPGAKKMALLATRLTTESGLYQRGAAQHGIDLTVKEEWQAMVGETLHAIKTSPTLEPARDSWRRLVEMLEADSVDAILIACTDLNAVSANTPDGLAVLDATHCLARETVRRWRSLTPALSHRERG